MATSEGALKVLSIPSSTSSIADSALTAFTIKTDVNFANTEISRSQHVDFWLEKKSPKGKLLREHTRNFARKTLGYTYSIFSLRREILQAIARVPLLKSSTAR